jgi:hypothetical protein
MVECSFTKNNGQRTCKYFVLGRDKSYLVNKEIKKKKLNSTQRFLKPTSSKCSTCLIDNTDITCCFVKYIMYRDKNYLKLLFVPITLHILLYGDDTHDTELNY